MAKMSEFVIRNMEESDLDQIMVVQRECYSEVEPEGRASFTKKIQLSGNSCWVAERDGEIMAYLICHPWRVGSVPELDSELFSVPDPADLFYLHDLAVSSRGRGQGLGRALVETALSFARKMDYERAGLIAVQKSSPFWSQFGFCPSTSLTAEGERKLKEYGQAAIYMENGEIQEIKP
jgi:ribosomal protein S18 acetylase RimI-like enzyme